MSNHRSYLLSDLCIIPDVDQLDENLKCGICLDILRRPILCQGGHSWCYDCIESSKRSKCPTCPALIDIKSPTENFTVKAIIEKIICRCPNSKNRISMSILAETDSHIMKKMKTTDTACAYSNNSNSLLDESDLDEFCQWSGTYEKLDNHLKVCNFIPKPCYFNNHGCLFVGKNRSLDMHYSCSSQSHILLMSKKLAKLIDDSKLIENKIEDVLYNKMHVIDDELSNLSNATNALIGKIKSESKVAIKWTISNVNAKLRNNTFINSENFEVSTLDNKTYNFYIHAQFGKIINDIGIFIYHSESQNDDAILPIDVGGSEIILCHEETSKIIKYIIPENCKIHCGLSIFCYDIKSCGHIIDDKITISVKVKLNNYHEKIFISN